MPDRTVDRAHLAHWIGDQCVVVHVDRAGALGPGIERHDPLDVPRDEVQHVAPDLVRIDRRGAVHPAQPRGHLADRGERLDRIAVGHHQPRVGIDREDRVQRDHVVGILERPGLALRAPLQRLQLALVDPVGAHEIGLVEQVVEVAGHAVQVVSPTAP